MRRQKRNLVLIFFPLLLTFTVFAALIVLSFWLRERSESPPKAAIVDHLSLTYPNPDFILSATDTLKQAGYEVDYYPGEMVTVNFYRNLPRYGYKILILRVHSARYQNIVQSIPIDFVGLFTSEPYSETKYLREQNLGQLGITSYYDGGPEYFGIIPLFITVGMRDKFNNTTVIMMGCQGLSTETTAQAFIEKGVKTVIGWNGDVSAFQTDTATTHLLTYWLTEGLSIREAVDKTMLEVGHDPFYNSELLFYQSQ